MRNFLLLCGAALVLAAAPKPSVAPDSALKPASVRLAQEGNAALAKSPSAAFDAYQAAAAVDPKNRAAFIGMARASQALGLPGKAVKFYREALQLEPNDLVAIEGQGEALVQRGAKTRALANLDRLKQLCGNCAQTTQLASVIAKAPSMVQQTADAAKTDPAKPAVKN